MGIACPEEMIRWVGFGARVEGIDFVLVGGGWMEEEVQSSGCEDVGWWYVFLLWRKSGERRGSWYRGILDGGRERIFNFWGGMGNLMSEVFEARGGGLS